MFLDLIRRRNPKLIEQAIALHQAGKLPANAYVIDLDAVEDNARAIAGAAAKFGLTVLAMTKQMGRNGSFCRAVKRGGIAKAVAVDMECARATHRAGMEVGHIGHLVQVPKREAEAAAHLSPDWWTVFNFDKAREAGAASRKRGRVQPLLARIQAAGDQFYRGHEGGFSASDIVAVAGRALRRHDDVSRPAVRSGEPQGEADAEPRNVAPGRRIACESRTPADRNQRPGHNIVGDRGGACGGGGNADRTWTWSHRHDPASCGGGPARTAGCGLSDGSLASRRE